MQDLMEYTEHKPMKSTDLYVPWLSDQIQPALPLPIFSKKNHTEILSKNVHFLDVFKDGQKYIKF